MIKNPLVQPVVKWVGGKRQLLPNLISLFPKGIESYCEPFFGGGAVLFNLQPEQGQINDINEDLMNMYTVIRDNVEELIVLLSQYRNEPDFFYSIRDWDRDKEKYNKLDKIVKASRLIYLNKTCYNGLFRVNNAGEFNTPYGYYKNPNIVNAKVLRAVHDYLNSANVIITSVDFSETLNSVSPSTLVYLDPPYDPVSNTASFTGYSKTGFSKDEQIRLKKECDELHKRGVKFVLSNSATPFIIDLYSNYKISTVQARRIVNSVASKRGDVDEVIVRNYE